MRSTVLGVEATLDIFSGRPNPTWPLTNQQIDELRARLAEPGQEMVEPVTPPGLGYRGVHVINSRKDERLPDALFAYKGVITTTRGRQTRHFADTTNIEEWLLGQARELGWGAAIDRFRG